MTFLDGFRFILIVSYCVRRTAKQYLNIIIYSWGPGIMSSIPGKRKLIDVPPPCILLVSLFYNQLSFLFWTADPNIVDHFIVHNIQLITQKKLLLY